ncbi:MAG TPA: oligosaccharide flippase family protein [Steroidobacteraceae bacterium]|nr:oligosaccharide flippase family protein [Steroidobacteraceae bacterium]
MPAVEALCYGAQRYQNRTVDMGWPVASLLGGKSRGARVSEPVASTLPKETSTKRALAFVYVGYSFRYLYLLVLIPFYGRVLGAAVYGRLVAAMALFQAVWLIAEYGFPLSGARDIAVSDGPRRAVLYGQHMSGRLTMSALALLVGVGGTYLSPVLRQVPLMGILATFVGLVASFNLGWYFTGIQRFRTSVSMEVLGFALNLPLILFFVRGPQDDWKVMAALLASSGVCTIVAHATALASMDRAAIRWGGAWQLIRGSTALFISRGLGMLLASASTYLISLLTSATELGLYGAAERLISAGLSLLQPTNQVLVSKVSRHVGSESTSDRAFTVIRIAAVCLTGLGISMLLGTELLGQFIVPLILGHEFAAAVPMVKALAITLPFTAINSVIISYVLIPFRFDRFVPMVSAISGAITLGLVVLLGRPYGGMGVVYARVVGEIVTLILLCGVLRKTQLSKRILAGSDLPRGVAETEVAQKSSP